MDSNEKIKAVGVNIQEKANLIWNVANTLFGAYKPHEYGLVILPMAVIKRFHDCLLPTHEKVLETYEKVKHLAVKEGFLRTATGGYHFYNVSSFTFEKLKTDPENIKANFEAYINGFSDNVIDILANMGFFNQIDRMNDAGVLYQVISDFCEDDADMSPDKISAVDMGYVFENLVQRFSESYDEEAGAHFTSRDIIYLMCDMLTMNADFSAPDAPAKTVYDMAMGTSQMLTCMEERIKALDSEADIICYGQEINPFTYGIAKADMLIRGGDPNNMQFGDTLNNDKFSGYTFDYCITKEDVVEDGDSACVRYGEIYSKYDCCFDECITRTNEALISPKRYFSYGDILFAGTGELVEEIGKNIAYLGSENCLAGGDIIIVSHTQNPIFLSYALNSNYCQNQKSHGKAKLKVVHIPSSDIGNLVVFLPPLAEQNKIAEFLNEKCSTIDSVIVEKQELMLELEQYKQSLIFEAVTGKRRVV